MHKGKLWTHIRETYTILLNQKRHCEGEYQGEYQRQQEVQHKATQGTVGRVRKWFSLRGVSSFYYSR